VDFLEKANFESTAMNRTLLPSARLLFWYPQVGLLMQGSFVKQSPQEPLAGWRILEKTIEFHFHAKLQPRRFQKSSFVALHVYLTRN
jgi:hypothetical protein